MIQELQTAERGAESDQRGYLLTGNDDYLGPYEAALSRSSVLLGELKRLTADNPAQQAHLQMLAPALQQLRTTRAVDRDPAGSRLQAAIERPGACRPGRHEGIEQR